jgi:hypothetical protein
MALGMGEDVKTDAGMRKAKCGIGRLLMEVVAVEVPKRLQVKFRIMEASVMKEIMEKEVRERMVSHRERERMVEMRKWE